MEALLEKKILGVIVATGEDLTIAQIADYTKASEEDVLLAVNELIKANKIKWNESDNQESNT